MTTTGRKSATQPRRRPADPGPRRGPAPTTPTEPTSVTDQAASAGRAKPADRVKPAGRAKPADPAERAKSADRGRSAAGAVKTQPGTKAQPKAEPGVEAERARPVARPRPRQSSGRPRAPFVLLILCLLGGALVSLLVLNTVLARDAYTLSALERSERQLIQQKQALTEEIAREEAPGRLALKARNQGMVQPSEPAFVDPGNGRVTGGRTVRPVPSAAAAAAAAAGVIGVPGAIVPGDGIPGWTGSSAGSTEATGSTTPTAESATGSTETTGSTTSDEEVPSEPERTQ